MKFFLITPLLLVISQIFANEQVDWKSTYDSIANKDEKLSINQIVEACEAGVENACQDGWERFKNRNIDSTQIINNPTLQPESMNKVEEYCNSSNSKFCNFGLNALSVALEQIKTLYGDKEKELTDQKKILLAIAEKATEEDNKKLNEIEKDISQLKIAIDHASQLKNKYLINICKTQLENAIETNICLDFIKNEHKELINEITNKMLETCKSLKNDTYCDPANALQMQLLSYNSNNQNTFENKICTNPEYHKLNICKMVAESIRTAERNKKESERYQMIGGSIFFVIVVFFSYIIYTANQCPACKKYRVVEDINTEYLGERFDGTMTKQEQVAEIRNSQNDVTATIHADVKYKNFSKHYLVTRRCKNCNHTYQEERSTSWKEKA